MIKIFYNIETHRLEKVDVENKISYEWDSNIPHVANFEKLVVVNTNIKQERKRDILYKVRWELVLSAVIFLLFMLIWNISIEEKNINNIPIIQKIITEFDTENKNSFGDWRCCKIIQECLGKNEKEIRDIIEQNYIETKK